MSILLIAIPHEKSMESMLQLKFIVGTEEYQFLLYAIYQPRSHSGHESGLIEFMEIIIFAVRTSFQLGISFE